MATIIEQINVSYALTKDCLVAYERTAGWRKSLYSELMRDSRGHYKPLLDGVAKSGDELVLAEQNVRAGISLHLASRTDIRDRSDRFINELTDAVVNGRQMVGILGIDEPQLPLQILEIDSRVIAARDSLALKVVGYNQVVRNLREHRHASIMTSIALAILHAPTVDELPTEINLAIAPVGV